MASAIEIYQAAQSYARKNGLPFEQVVSDPQIMSGIDRTLTEQNLVKNSEGLSGNTPQAAANSGNAMGGGGLSFAPLGDKVTPVGVDRPPIPETALAPTAPPQGLPPVPQWARADQGAFGNPVLRDAQLEMLSRDPEPTVNRQDIPSITPNGRIAAIDEPFEGGAKSRLAGNPSLPSTSTPVASPAEIADAEKSAPYRNEQWDIAEGMNGLQQKYAGSPYMGPAMNALKSAQPGQTAGDVIRQVAPMGFGGMAVNKAQGMGLPVNMQASRINDAINMQRDVRQSLSNAPAPQRKPEYNSPQVPSVPRSAPMMAQRSPSPSNETVFAPSARPATYQAGAGGSYGRAVSTPAAPRTVSQQRPAPGTAAQPPVAKAESFGPEDEYGFDFPAPPRTAIPNVAAAPKLNTPMPMGKPKVPTIPISKGRLQQMVKATKALQRPRAPVLRQQIPAAIQRVPQVPQIAMWGNAPVNDGGWHGTGPDPNSARAQSATTTWR